MPNDLTTTESHRLTTLESTIERGRQSFVEVGTALIEIRESKLYRQQAETFEGYCQTRWEFTRRRASQLMMAAEVIAEVSAAGEKREQLFPSVATEGVAREVAKAPKGERAAVVREAVATAPKDKKTGKPKVTAKHVERVVAKRKDKSQTTEPAESPPPTADRVGAPLPPHVAEAFANAARHDNIKNLLALVTRDVNFLTGPADGKPPPGGELISNERTPIYRSLQLLKDLTAPMRPHAVCPHCKAQPRKTPCQACEGRGWLAKSQYEQVPADLRGGMKPAA